MQQATERRGQFAPHFTGRVVGEPGEAPRLRLSAAGLVQPAHLAHLDEVLQLHAVGGAAPISADAARLSTPTWDVPLRATQCGAPRDWASVLAEFFHDGRDNMQLPSTRLLGALQAAVDDDAAEAGLRRLASRAPALSDTLHGFQREAVRFGLQRGGRVLLGDEMGLGKSLQALALATAYEDDWPLLIVCPSAMRYPWLDYVEKWLPFVAPDDVQLLRRKMDMVLPRRVTILSYKGLTMLEKPLLALHRRQPFGMVLVDESHRIGTNGKESWILGQICVEGARRAARLLLLSGSPMVKDPKSMFGQLRLLSAGSVPELSELGRNPARFPDRDCFGARFCAGYNTGPEKFWCPQRRDYRMGDRGWWGVNTESFSEFQQLINTMMKRRLKTEVKIPLQTVNEQKVIVGVGSAQRSCLEKYEAAFNEASDNFRAAASDPSKSDGQRRAAERLMHKWHYAVVMATAYAKANMKVSSAEWKALPVPAEDDDGDEAPASSAETAAAAPAGGGGGGGGGGGADDETDALEWLKVKLAALASSGEKLLLFAHHKHVVTALSTFLSDKKNGVGDGGYVTIVGETNAEDRQTFLARFTEEPGCRVALLSIMAFGEGVTLTAANHVVFFELMPLYKDHAQAQARADRIGQTRPVDVYFLCARDTHDEKVYVKLERQRALQKRNLGDGDGGDRGSVGGSGGVADGDAAMAPAAAAAPTGKKRKRVFTSAFGDDDGDAADGGGSDDGGSDEDVPLAARISGGSDDGSDDGESAAPDARSPQPHDPAAYVEASWNEASFP